MLGWLEAHRGPFLFCVDRPGKKPGFHVSAWLPGEVEKTDVEEEAEALLSDPRDTIEGVSVWSVKEEQFVGGFRRGKRAITAESVLPRVAGSRTRAKSAPSTGVAAPADTKTPARAHRHHET